MKFLVAVVIALAILQVYTQQEKYLSQTPQEQLKNLEQLVRFKKSTADSQIKNDRRGSLFGSLFGGDNIQDLTKLLSEQNEQGSDNKLTINQNLDRFSQLMNSLPYEALLPRRRRPLSLLNKVMKGQQDSSEQSDDPLEELDRLLSIKKKKKNKQMHWQNPDFKDGSRDAPFMKIFGPKSKLKHRIQINEQNIHQLLIDSVPSLKGGKMLKMSYVPHRKGIFLNIEYETVKEQIYTIKAKYLRKSNQLEIISMTQINVLRKVDDDDEDSNQEVEITVVKPQVVNQPVEKIQEKEAQKIKAQERIEPKAQERIEPKAQEIIELKAQERIELKAQERIEPKPQEKIEPKPQKKNGPKKQEKNESKKKDKIEPKVQQKIGQESTQKVEAKSSQQIIPSQNNEEVENSSAEEEVQQESQEFVSQQSDENQPASNLSKEPRNKNDIETN